MQQLDSRSYVICWNAWGLRSASKEAIFRKRGVAAKVNLQRAGAQAKPYQVKQVRAVILEEKLGDE